jgi:hypothetical protein
MNSPAYVVEFSETFFLVFVVGLTVTVARTGWR